MITFVRLMSDNKLNLGRNRVSKCNKSSSSHFSNEQFKVKVNFKT